MKDFLAMGGYAFYVWSSFGLTFVVMAAILFNSRYQRRRAIAVVKRNAVIEQRKAQKVTAGPQASEGLQ